MIFFAVRQERVHALFDTMPQSRPTEPTFRSDGGPNPAMGEMRDIVNFMNFTSKPIL
jgi:hypothetical protein